ncbi:MAG: recombination mediator RecR [Spirochaetia bacterium]|nr:recombination mediator RecR [Spirochaetota bacterium]MDW8112995.1 recombination mediator RecR [Spirochaetia bacterium]
MNILPNSVKEMIEVLSDISGIGPKTAERIALFIITSKSDIISRLSNVIEKLKNEVKVCSECGMVSDTDPCVVCSSLERNRKVICVVEKPSDVLVIEKTEQYDGLYHVLGGVISPLDGVGPGDLPINKLIDRIKKLEVEEVFFALDPDSEGEITTSYIVSLIRKSAIDVKITSVAKGVPLGGNIEYSDTLTLSRAIKNRSIIDSY